MQKRTRTTRLDRCRKRARRKVDWLDLPRDVTMSILRRLDQAEILVRIQFVCAAWLHICRDPQMWRSIELEAPVRPKRSHYLIGDDAVRGFYVNLCLRAFHYSSGHLIEIAFDDFVTDDLLVYICERSSQLKCLRLRYCDRVSPEALLKAVASLPLLEELEFRVSMFPAYVFEVIASCCPNLKTLKYNCHAILYETSKLNPLLKSKQSFAIAQNFPRLRHLELICTTLEDDGLRAILDGCPHLESLDLLFCIYLDLSCDLLERCYKQIKHLRLPLDGALDKVNDIYRPFWLFSGHFLRVTHTLLRTKPSLLSATMGRGVHENQLTEPT